MVILEEQQRSRAQVEEHLFRTTLRGRKRKTNRTGHRFQNLSLIRTSSVQHHPARTPEGQAGAVRSGPPHAPVGTGPPPWPREPCWHPSSSPSTLQTSPSSPHAATCRSSLRTRPQVRTDRSGVGFRDQVRSDGGASLSGHLSDFSTRWQPSASPTRRLRFEDETETEVETRYLERQLQRRRVGQQGTGVLMSKLDLNQCITIRSGPRGAEPDQQQRGRPLMRVACPVGSGGVMFGAQLDRRLTKHPPVTQVRGSGLTRPHLQVRTELLKDSYIGYISPADSGEGGSGGISKPVRCGVNKTGITQVTTPQAPPTAETPVNPYASYTVGMPPQPSTARHQDHKRPSALNPPAVTSLMMSQNGRLNNTTSGEDLTQNQEEKKKPSSTEPQTSLELKKRRPCSSSAEGKAPPTSGSTDEHPRHPVREELHSAISFPGRFSRDGPSRLSLRRLFCSVKLSKTRTGSLDRLATKPHPLVPDHLPSDCRKSCSLFKKSPSAQSLYVGALGLQMKKSSSVQSFGSEESKNRCADYRPEQFLPWCLDSEDIGQPCSVRSVGRVLQVCSDGTVLLELSRPSDQSFGFTISRGKGRADSGVYVEDMVDRNSEKLYAGLLSVGDEILEVNMEKVACLNLDQVNQVLVQNPTTTVRILRQRRPPPYSGN
ncbi:uncharacterized protein FYW61_003574 [Anableps anableps]